MVINRVYIIYTVYYIILYIYIYIYPIFIQTHVLRFFRGSPVRSPESRTGAFWRLGWHHLRKFTTSRAHASSWTATGFGDRGAHGGEFELNFFSFMLTTCLQSCCRITVWNWSVESVGFFVVVSNMFFWE